MTAEPLIGRTVGIYRVVEQVGRGGMTVVYRALDHNGRAVAVKVLAPYVAQQEQFRARFQREIRVLQELRHENIVPILDFGELDGQGYIAMPFYPAGTLADRLRAGALTPTEAMRILDQVSAALQRAHDAGVVHRDVKPSNILLDEKGDAYLSDFGFAQVGDASISLTGSALIGTPAFISPEQGRGLEVTPKSDQYSLGVVLYQLATGRLPFEGDTPMGLIIKHVNEPLPRPRFYSPNLPDAVEAVLVKALAKDPAHRFSTVAAFNAAFQESMRASLTPSGKLKMQPGAPKRPAQFFPDTHPTHAYQRPRFWTRRRVVAAAGLTLLLLPGASWALHAILPGAAGPLDAAAYAATFSAVGTQAASMGGSDEEVARSVAATISALGLGAAPPTSGANASNGGGSPGEGDTLPPGAGLFFPTPTLSPTTVAGGALPSPTPTSPDNPPASTPTPGSSPTAPPTGTSAPPPSDTPAATPTDTPQPAPTNPPEPTIDPWRCDLPTQNPNYEYCTPTAGG